MLQPLYSTAHRSAISVLGTGLVEAHVTVTDSLFVGNGGGGALQLIMPYTSGEGDCPTEQSVLAVEVCPEHIAQCAISRCQGHSHSHSHTSQSQLHEHGTRPTVTASLAEHAFHEQHHSSPQRRQGWGAACRRGKCVPRSSDSRRQHVRTQPDGLSSTTLVTSAGNEGGGLFGQHIPNLDFQQVTPPEVCSLL